LGFKWGKDLVHFSYGMVELPNGKIVDALRTFGRLKA